MSWYQIVADIVFAKKQKNQEALAKYGTEDAHQNKGNPQTDENETLGVWNDGINQGKRFMNLNMAPTINSKVSEIGGQGTKEFGGLRNRLQGNRQRQYGLLRSEILKGLLRNGQI